MKPFKRVLFSAALAFASLAANAGTYNFSYSFAPGNTGDGNPLTVTGSLSGDLVGSILENISNVHVSLNGNAFSGPLFAEGFNESTQAWDNTVAPVVSTNASQNNFIFADTDVSVDPGASNYFWAVDGQTLAVDFNATDAGNNPLSGFETANAATWTLVAAPVPEPASYAMLIAGLGLIGVAARRRSQG